MFTISAASEERNRVEDLARIKSYAQSIIGTNAERAVALSAGNGNSFAQEVIKAIKEIKRDNEKAG